MSTQSSPCSIYIMGTPIFDIDNKTCRMNRLKVQAKLYVSYDTRMRSIYCQSASRNRPSKCLSGTIHHDHLACIATQSEHSHSVPNRHVLDSSQCTTACQMKMAAVNASPKKYSPVVRTRSILALVLTSNCLPSTITAPAPRFLSR